MSVSEANAGSPSISVVGEISVENSKRSSRNISYSDLLKKLVIAMLFIFVGNPVSLLVIGVINRLSFRFIDTAFVCYAANESYRQKYWFKAALPLISVFPAIVGFYFQGGKMGIIFVISSIERDFRDTRRLSRFMSNVNLVRALLGVKACHYSGFLPTELGKRSLVGKEYLTERCEMVAKVVLAAEHQVRDLEGIVGYLPVIVLGGKGNVGSRIIEGLKESGRRYYSVDKEDHLPMELKHKRCIVIDVARKGAVEQYMGKFWDGMIFLNETYPEPDKAVLERLSRLNIPAYHVSGVSAKAYPRFPRPYAGGVPCCALINDSNLQALVKKL